MKRPQPDLSENIKNTFVAKIGANRKLKRLWGTTTVNGTEVLHARRHYYKKSYRPSNYEKLFKFLKVYEDVKDYKGKGVRAAWFTLSKSKGRERNGSRNVPASFVADNLNRMWWDSNDGAMPENLTLTTTVTISENFDNKSTISGIGWGNTEEEAAQYIEDNYESFWSNKKILQEGVGVINKGSTFDENLNVDVQDEDDLSPDDPWMAILSRYALRNSGVPCTVKSVEVGLGSGRGTVYNTIVVTLEIPYVSFSTGDAIVQSITGDLNTPDSDFEHMLSGRYSKSHYALSGANSSNVGLTKSLAKQISYYENEDDLEDGTISRQYVQWEDSASSSEYENLWLKHDKKYYLKADVIMNPKAYGFTHIELNDYIFSLLDTGYKKKKVSMWKKVVAVVVFVIAVVLTFVPGAQGAAAIAYNAAYAIMVGALVLSLITAALSAVGMNEWSMAFSEVSRDIEPLVTVAAIFMVVTSFIQSGAYEALKTYATEEFNEMAFEAILGEFGDLGKLVADAMDGKLEGKTLDTINRMAEVYTSVQLKKLENIGNRNKDLKAEYDKLAEETAMNTDIMRGYMNIYARPATADWSVYASTFDLPYERGGGALSMGNIQRTTKQATRKTDYKEPMFEGILLV